VFVRMVQVIILYINIKEPGVVCADSDTIQRVLNRNYIHF